MRAISRAISSLVETYGRARIAIGTLALVALLVAAAGCGGGSGGGEGSAAENAAADQAGTTEEAAATEESSSNAGGAHLPIKAPTECGGPVVFEKQDPDGVLTELE